MFSVIFMMNKRLLYLRETFNFSQQEMANFLHTSKSNYARWETGETIIPFKYVLYLSNKTNLSLDYIFAFTNQKRKNKQKINYNSVRIGKNIRKLRKQQNLTQKEFADSIHTTQSVISDYEHGYKLIQTAFLYDICKIYKISADTLVQNEIWETYHNA